MMLGPHICGSTPLTRVIIAIRVCASLRRASFATPLRNSLTLALVGLVLFSGIVWSAGPAMALAP
jgi:hypothetical protein